MGKNDESLVKSREIRSQILSKYGEIPKSIYKPDYSWGKHVIELEAKKQHNIAIQKHKKLSYGHKVEIELQDGTKKEVEKKSQQQWKAYNASSKSIRGKDGGLSTFPPALARRIVLFYSEKGDTVLDPMCVSGDTIISTPNGDFPIKNLVGQEPYVYCSDGVQLRLRKANQIRKTRINATVLEVKLDNDNSIFVTPDHKFMLRNGKYIEAKLLKSGDSLMPFYRKIHKQSGRWIIGLNNGKYMRQSIFIMQEILGRKLKTKEFIECVHHKDEDITNDSVENLKVKDFGKHSKMHHEGKIMYIPSDEQKKHLSKIFTGLENPFFGKKHSTVTKKQIGIASKGRNVGGKHSFETKKKMSESWKKRKNKTYVNQIQHLISEGNLSYEKIALKMGVHKNTVINISTKRFNYNHTVKSVEEYPTKIDTYNMNVEEFHNFVANGVIVKNCGHNSRMQVTYELERDYIGYDVSKEFMKFNNTVKDEIMGKGNQKLIFTPSNTITLKEQSSEKLDEEDNSMDMCYTCYSDDTEVLTDGGFKLFKNLKMIDKIATLDEGDNLIYVKLIEIQKNKYKGIMYEVINKKGFNLLVTPNHNMYIRKRHKKDYELLNVTKCKKQDKIKMSANWIGVNKDFFILPSIITEKNHIRKDNHILMEDWMTFLGWYISEGWCYYNRKQGKLKKGSNYSVSICQRDIKVLENIKKTMSKYGFKGTIKKDTLSFNSKQLYLYLNPLGKSYEKYIPKEFLSLDRKYLICLFNSLMLGDGNGKGANNTYFTSSAQLATDFMELVIKLGKKANMQKRVDCGRKFIRGREIFKKHDSYSIVIGNGCERQITEINKVKYDGFVYCCSIPNQKLFVRRKGKGCWCGNSPPYWDLEYYGDEKEQLGYNHSYGEFLNGLGRVVNECHRVLKRDKYCIFNVNDFRKNGILYTYHSDVIELFKKAGFNMHDIIVVEWASAMGACFSFNTKVLTENGYKNIGDIKVGEKVFTDVGKLQKVSKVFKRKENDIIDLKVKGLCDNIKITGEHPVLSIKRKDLVCYKDKTRSCFGYSGKSCSGCKNKLNKKILKWYKISELKEGDFISTQSSTIEKNNIFLNVFNYIKTEKYILKNNKICFKLNKKNLKYIPNKIKIDEKFARLIGYYLSEGCSNSKGLRFTFHEKEINYITDVCNLVKELFGLESIIKNSKIGKWSTIYIYSSILAEFFDCYLGKGFDKKSIPKHIFISNKNIKENLLIGLFRGDGCLTGNDISFGVSNEILIKETQSLLGSIGYSFYLREYYPKLSKNKTYQIRLAENKCIDFVEKTFNKKITQNTTKRYDFKIGDITVRSIVSMKKNKFNDYVYNLEINKNHTYIAEGIICHNCFASQVEDRKITAKSHEYLIVGRK